MQAAIKRIEGDLLRLRYELEGDGAVWVFHAGLFLMTQLDELNCHGLVEHGAYSDLPSLAMLSSRTGWFMAGPTLRDLGVDVDEAPSIVTSDIDPIPSHGEPFQSFLLIFRSLIESGIAMGEIELGLDILTGRDKFTAAVFGRLGPTKLMMRRAGIL